MNVKPESGKRKEEPQIYLPEQSKVTEDFSPSLKHIRKQN